MEAEFIVISGPLQGTRFSLGEGDIRLGRADTAQIRLTEPEAAREHCVVRRRDGRFRIADCHTGAGTYINGMRTAEHALEPDDQVSIGETVMVYREESSAGAGSSADQTLLRACALLFLFRAIALSQSSSHRV